MIRKVQVYRAGKLDPDTRQPAKEEAYIGTFLEFGVMLVEAGDRWASTSCALVETPCGGVEQVMLRNLRFVCAARDLENMTPKFPSRALIKGEERIFESAESLFEGRTDK